MPYDVQYGISDPDLYGVAGGVSYKDFKTPQFVGYGNFTTPRCQIQNPGAGYILTKPASEAGAYFPCVQDYHSLVNVHYLLRHSNLKWIPTDSSAMMSVPGVITIGSDVPFFFGRVLLDGNYHIGKVHAGAGAFGIWLNAANGALDFTSNYEILTCQPS